MSQARHEHEIAAEQAIDFYKKVAEIQNTLHAPKGQDNKFGGYKYRNCEDILEGLKKVKGDLVVIISDEIIIHGDRFYIKATATITDGVNYLSNSAFAREALTKKGMDDAQLTGSSSSYARKYALNGLFCIDDTKDPDSMDNRANGNSAAKSNNIDLRKVAKDCGWTIDQVLNSYNPPLAAIEEITDKAACKAFLESNKIG